MNYNSKKIIWDRLMTFGYMKIEIKHREFAVTSSFHFTTKKPIHLKPKSYLYSHFFKAMVSKW